jgi:glycosyltransferase 2 family protein
MRRPGGKDLGSFSGRTRATILVFLSLALGLAGLYLVVGGAVFRLQTYRVQNLRVPLLMLALIAFLAKWLSPAARITLLCRAQKMSLPFRSALLAHLGAMFVAAFTPNNTGVGPATVAALGRLGVPLGRGIGVAVQLFVLDLIFFAWAVPLSLAYLSYTDAIALPPGARVAALAATGLTITGAVALIRHPRPVARLLLASARWPLLGRFAPRLRRSARDYYRSAVAFRKATFSTWFALNAFTISQWFGSFMLFWSLLGLYGVDTSPLKILAILSSLTLVSHFVPTPGAAGFMEAAVGLSLGGRAGGDTAAALLIWRLASFYVIFILGPLAGWFLHLARPTAAPFGITDGESPTHGGRSRP